MGPGGASLDAAGVALGEPARPDPAHPLALLCALLMLYAGACGIAGTAVLVLSLSRTIDCSVRICWEAFYTLSTHI